MTLHPAFYIAAALSITALLSVVWAQKIGWVRAELAAILRCLWLLPWVACLFPQPRSEVIPQEINRSVLRLLVDDSQSMQQRGGAGSGEGWLTQQWLQEQCVSLGCTLQVDNLSQLDQRLAEGYSPLVENLQAWMFAQNSDPWIFVSDGADWMPAVPLAERGMTHSGSHGPPGLIMGVGGDQVDNLWIEEMDLPGFSFDQRPFEVKLSLGRSGPQFLGRDQRIQVQLKSGDVVLASTNVLMPARESLVDVQMLVPALVKGRDLLKAEILPVPGEGVLWDNQISRIHEVLPNTVGLLHLLGSPSWDGRFLRRYLKSEPKFDLISFFILRDRWDSQPVNERELSLIPFPVDRLFNEELPNFKGVIIQNFAMFEFLEAEYQDNLLNFVEEGGSLLFIGGPRALQSSDLYSSSMAKILPFEVDADKAPPRSRGFPFAMRPEPQQDQVGPYYEDKPFQIEFNQIEEQSRALASVVDDWRPLQPELSKASILRGYHRMDRVKLKEGETTVLLSGKTKEHGSVPLIVASYPGKGRALWVFSDSLWRLAFDPNPDIARSTYDRFIASSMQWLLRGEMRQPLLVREFKVFYDDHKRLQWSLRLMGPVARYFELSDAWQLKICDEVIDASKVRSEKSGGGEWLLSAPLQQNLKPSELCRMEISGRQRQFGKLNVKSSAVIPEIFKDEQLAPVTYILESLARQNRADYMNLQEGWQKQARSWLERVMERDESITAPKTVVYRDHYWLFSSAWIWLLAIAMPLEVVVRRWHKIAGGRRRLRKVKQS